jgi:choline dehydrogenase-like flavoprotein
MSESFVHRIEHALAKGRVTDVAYLDTERREHRINAKVVVLAAHAV